MSVRSEMNNLTEAAKVSDSKIKALQSKVKELQESSQSSKRKDQALIESLQNEIVELKRDSQLKHSQYTQKLKESKEQSKKYQKLAKNAVDKYIECKSDALGISPESVKSRLNESFTLLDVDNAFENLRKYNLNMSKLPFQVNNVKKVSMKEACIKMTGEGLAAFERTECIPGQSLPGIRYRQFIWQGRYVVTAVEKK